MTAQLDEELKDYLQDSLRDIKLTWTTRQRLQRLMLAEMERKRLPWWQRLLCRVNDFMDITFEISLLPVTAALCIAVMVVGTAVLELNGYSFSYLQLAGKEQLVYIQQVTTGPDGTMQIVYIPSEMEGTGL